MISALAASVGCAHIQAVTAKLAGVVEGKAQTQKYARSLKILKGIPQQTKPIFSFMHSERNITWFSRQKSMRKHIYLHLALQALYVMFSQVQATAAVGQFLVNGGRPYEIIQSTAQNTRKNKGNSMVYGNQYNSEAVENGILPDTEKIR